MRLFKKRLPQNGNMIAAECWTEIEGVQMRYHRAGAGLPLLLIHGLLGGSFCWRFNIPILAEHYTVHAVDLPGLGSTGAYSVECGIVRQVERLCLFIDGMKWSSLSVIGASYGGAIALLLAARDAQSKAAKIRSLVLSAPVNPWSRIGIGRIRFFGSRLGGAFLRMAMPVSHPVYGFALRHMYGDPACIVEGTLEGYRKAVMRPGRARNVLTALRSWEKDVGELQSAIRDIGIPTLLIWGTRDRTVDPSSAMVLRKHFANSELAWLDGAGHLPFEEVPEDFNRLVLDFLDRKMA
jgi:4,5:9,10-diseco-3-hydroxy-5,9,17-trioxoandrosta-1(10),2-diene-4-oate hydrolase